MAKASTPPGGGGPGGGGGIGDAIGEFIKSLLGFGAASSEAGDRLKNFTGQAIAGFTTLVARTTHAGDALHALIGPIETVEGKLGSWVNQASKFIAAFNPSLLEVFDQALRSLHATVGYALEPVIVFATEAIREFAGAIRPAMDALREPMQKLFSIMLPIVSAGLQAFGAVLSAAVAVFELLMPVINAISAVFEGFLSIIVVAIKLFAALAEGLAGAASLGKLNDAATGVRDAFARLIIVAMTMVDYFLRLVGATAMANNFLRVMAQGPRSQEGRAPAPQNVQLGGVEDVYKRRLTEAAKAGGGASPMERIASVLDQVRAHAQGLLENSGRALGLLDLIASSLGMSRGSTATRLRWFQATAESLRRISPTGL